MIDPGLKGKVALVTGANHGIGAATSIRASRSRPPRALTATLLSTRGRAL